MSLRSNLRALLTLGRGVFKGITTLEVGADPIAYFGDWYEDARESGLFLPESACLVTANEEGVPSGRMVLLKGFDERGFVFYTNYESRKGEDLAQNPRASLVFYWGVLERQVRVEGTAEKVSTEESEAYFRTRPRGSQIGAWASDQSRPLESREVLERRFREHEERFRGETVPLPPYWGGYRLRPEWIEFWQGRVNRLHDRLAYRRSEDGWTVTRLAP